MKYIPIDPESLEDYVDIWLEFAVALNPFIDEIKSRELMVEFLILNDLSAHGAAFMGNLVRATESITGKFIH